MLIINNDFNLIRHFYTALLTILLFNQKNVNGEIFTSVGQMISLVETHELITQQLENFVILNEKSLNKAKEYFIF
jgi:hypothetical protein